MRVPTSASHCCGHQSVEAGPGSVCRRGCGRRCPAVLCTRPHPRPPPNLPHPSTHTFNRTWRAAKSSNEKMLPARAGDAIVCVPCTGRPGRRQAVQPLRLRRSRGWARMRWRGWWCGVPGERHPLWPCAAARRTLPPAARAAGARARLGAGRPAQGPVGWSLRGSQPSRTGSLGAVAQPACGACAGDGRPTLPGAPMDAPRRWSRRTWTGAFADAEIERAYWDDQHVECAFFFGGQQPRWGSAGRPPPSHTPSPGPSPPRQLTPCPPPPPPSPPRLAHLDRLQLAVLAALMALSSAFARRAAWSPLPPPTTILMTSMAMVALSLMTRAAWWPRRRTAALSVARVLVVTVVLVQSKKWGRTLPQVPPTRPVSRWEGRVGGWE